MKYMLFGVWTFLFMFAGTVYSQSIRGFVRDQSGKALEEVAVVNRANGKYTYTSDRGMFEIESNEGHQLIQFFLLGYEKEELKINTGVNPGVIEVTLRPAEVSLDQVVLVSGLNPLKTISKVDVELNPVRSSQELLRRVPGLIIGQHAGGGKAEQIFLRGFDIDHGTDINLSMDGLPVNMVSHAHGQGYSDLHFIIPETVKSIDYGKGPYRTDKGNFTTAGYADLNLLKKIDRSRISAEVGQFDTFRLMGMTRLLASDTQHAYLASELISSDGFFESSQNFNRVNVMGRYLNEGDASELMLTLSHFQSTWDASGQIPQRAVDAGLITRFGAIDDTEGGNTSRSNVLLNHKYFPDDESSVVSKAYLSKYDFELFSNFTFFLEDPENGDQIRQFEDRLLMGAETVYQKGIYTDENSEADYRAGIGFRYDDVNNVQLSHTKNRTELLERLAWGDVDETNAYGMAELNYRRGHWKFNTGLRLDHFLFAYNDLITEAYDPANTDKTVLSPKFNVDYQVSEKWQLLFRSGMGFHSNDSRVVNTTKREVLPKAYGMDLGTVWKPSEKLWLNSALWWLHLDQEFVYVGDAGIVEPSGKTRRYGLDLGLRYEALPWLFLYSDINYAHARSIDDPDGENLIPLAPELTSTGGITLTGLGGFSGGLNYRFIDDRPANEDNSIVAEGYFVTDLNLNYNWKEWQLSVIVENLFDTEWNETQFATESRLSFENAPVEEIHFTPGTPFFMRLRISRYF